MIVFRPLLWPTMMAAAGIAVLIGLGTWQLDRREQKHALIAQADENSQMAPVALPPVGEWADLDMQAWEYRPVEVSGVYQHDREIHVFTSLSEPRGPQGGPGYWVLTPLALDGGGTLIVNRGFVPDNSKYPSTRTQGQVTGEQTLVGLVRRSEARGMLVPPADRETNTWYARDVGEIAAALAIDDAAPFLVDASDSAPGGLPQGGETRLSFPDSHFAYALTWYGLAVSLFVVYLAYHRALGRLGRGL